MNYRGVFIVIAILFIGLAFSFVRDNARKVPLDKVVTNFDECVAAGNDVLEIYPRQCRTGYGKNFTEDIGNELDKADMIRAAYPRPNGSIESPVRITGEARGTWFFEGDFPIFLYDSKGRALGVAIAKAQGEWMSEEFVPFTAELNFDIPADMRGEIIFKRNNPSDKPEFNDELVMPVRLLASQGVAKSFSCDKQGREADACIALYDPVCATVQVQCIRAPCDPVLETFSSSCEACKNSLVSSYTSGVCTGE